MKTLKNKNKCTGLRARLVEAIESRMQMDAGWLGEHVATCPRCQKRLGNIAKVNLAFSVLRSQSHSADLFKNANSQAVGTLKHSLRDSAAAEKLREFQPQPNIINRNSRVITSMASAAACITILFLLKVGIFYSIDNFKQKGNKSARQYYAKYIDEETVNDIFTA